MNKGASPSVRGALFDRLVDTDPGTLNIAPSQKTMTVGELKESVRTEIAWLLNTRCPTQITEKGDTDRHFYNYGIPDFSCFFPDSNANRKRLAQTIQNSITAYEPRLKNVAVSVDDFMNREDKFSLQITIKAYLIINKVREPVTFVMNVG